MGYNLGIDLVHHETYANGTPHALFAQLRRECPIYWNERRDGKPGLWCITKYADIGAVSKDTETFTSTHGTSIQREEDEEAMAGKAVITTDPPRHTRVRSAIARGISPKSVASLEGVIRQRAIKAINAIIEQGGGDFYEVAAALPVSMICRLLGLPEGMDDAVLAWTNRIFGSEDPELSHGPEDVMSAWGEVHSLALELAADRRRNPQDDLITELTRADTPGDALSDEEIAWNFALLLGAGNDTTRTLIMNGLNCFLEHPDAFAEIQADARLIPNAIEEVLRCEPSVRGMGRLATRDVTLGDVRISAGDHVYMWYASGNYDEEVFASPERFDIHRREAKRHQAFGYGGPHFCIGAPLARLQSRIVFELLSRHLPDIRHDGPPVRARSNGFINGFKSFPVAFAPRRAIAMDGE